jgi:F0F1-type ATP synthase assembly protein I
MKNLSKSNPRKSKPSAPSNYAKYTGIAFQMIAIILVGVFGGIKLDQVTEKVEFPLFTLVFTFIAVCLSIYYTIKDLMRIK